MPEEGFVISQQPENLQSANNDSVYVVSSVNATATGSFDYKYIAHVYSGDSDTLIATLVAFPDPLFGYGVFNLRTVTATLVSYDFAGYEPTASVDSTGFFHLAGNSSKQIYIGFGETYYDITGNYNENDDVVFSDPIVYLNSSVSYKKFTPDYLTQFNIDNGSDPRNYLQSKPNSPAQPIKAYNKLRQWLYYYNGGGVTSSNEVDIVTFGSDPEIPIGSYRLLSPFDDAVEGVRYISTGVPQLAALSEDAYAVIFGDPDIINDDVQSYVVGLGRINADAEAMFFFYQIYNDCSKYSPDSYRVYWLNTLGGFDSWLFNKMQINTTNKNQTSYKQTRGILTGDATFGYNTYQPGVINFYTQTQDQYKLSTDFLTDGDVQYLKGLFSSPAIFLEDKNGIIISATVDDNNYLLNKTVNTKMYALAMTFNAAVTNERQLL